MTPPSGFLLSTGAEERPPKEIAAWLAQSGSKLGGFGRERTSPSMIPTMTTEAAASPRPRPLSATAKAARVPQSPESLVGARSERVHVQKGKLIAAVPIKLSKPK